MDKVDTKRNNNGTYLSTIEGTKQWIADHREIHNERVRRYYYANREKEQERKRNEYSFKKAYNQLAGIEIY